MANGETTLDEVMGFLQENMMTKAEGATKEDLKAFATKEDLKAFATKEDLRSTELRFLDAMDDKLAHLKADLTVLMRNEDKKLVNLITLMKNKGLISEEEAAPILAMNPFPQQ